MTISNNFTQYKFQFFLTLKIIIVCFILFVVCGGGFLLWQHYYPVKAYAPWQYKVIHKNITKASALYKDKQGNLMVAEELNNSQGRIIKIAVDGTRTTLFDKLNKPDGISAFQGGIVFSQEGGIYPVTLLKHYQTTNLFIGTNVQGLTPYGQYLYAVEDRGVNSRILRYDASTGDVTIVREKLNEAETLAICPNGNKYYNEKKIHQIKQLTADGKDPIILDYKKTREPSILQCDENGLWISEDSTHRARLLLLTTDGKLQTILSHLRAPQQLLKITEDTYYLAEGGRNRVLELKKLSK